MEQMVLEGEMEEVKSMMAELSAQKDIRLCILVSYETDTTFTGGHKDPDPRTLVLAVGTFPFRSRSSS